MNFQFKKLGKGMRIVKHNGKPIGTLELSPRVNGCYRQG